MYRFCASTHPLAIVFVILALAIATAKLAVAVEIAPYQARVIVAGASVHSGPGEKFYPTDTLAQGDLVDVYHEKPGGWLGIRPTVNSFSWVSGRELKLRDGGLGEILQDNVASRIGSRLNDKHNAAQVRLRKGEMVEVVGEDAFNGETWYKIAPPAGEFRWIQASLIERIGPLKQETAEAPPSGAPVAEAKAAAKPAATGSATASGAAPPANGSEAPPLLSDKPQGDGWTKSGGSTETPSAVGTSSNSSTNTSADSTSATPPAPSTPPTDAAADSARHLPPAASAQSSLAPPTLNDELAAIEVRLSRMASAPTSLWNTNRLESDAVQLLNRAQTPAEREAVQATLAKINRFSSITRKTNSPGTATLAQSGQPPITPLAGGPAANSGDSQYDAVGILRPVVSRRPGAPQFALVDDHGQVLSFVTPSPDVNLQAYLGRRVGVVGNKGYIAEFNRSHVTAARVTPMVR